MPINPSQRIAKWNAKFKGQRSETNRVLVLQEQNSAMRP
jgi:hypothetical protein